MVLWHTALWCAVVRCAVALGDPTWPGVGRSGGAVWDGTGQCGLRCGVVGVGVQWCGVVWCGVAWWGFGCGGARYCHMLQSNSARAFCLSGMDAGNLLKPMLARGELRCIGATTLDEYRKYVEKDPALERRYVRLIRNSHIDTFCPLFGAAELSP